MAVVGFVFIVKMVPANDSRARVFADAEWQPYFSVALVIKATTLSSRHRVAGAPHPLINPLSLSTLVVTIVECAKWAMGSDKGRFILLHRRQRATCSWATVSRTILKRGEKAACQRFNQFQTQLLILSEVRHVVNRY